MVKNKLLGSLLSHKYRNSVKVSVGAVNSKLLGSVPSHKYRNLVKIHRGGNLDRVTTLHYQSSDFRQDLKEVMTTMIFVDHFHLNPIAIIKDNKMRNIAILAEEVVIGRNEPKILET